MKRMIAAAVLLSSCAPAATNDADAKPPTETHRILAELAFLKGSDALVSPDLPVEPHSIKLCVADRLKGKFNLGGIIRATGSSPFRLSSDQCRAYVDEARPAGGPWSLTRKIDGCEFYVRLANGAVEDFRTVVTGDPQSYLMKCLYRTGMFFQGYGGSIELPDERLFEPTQKTALAGEETVVGKWVPVLLWKLRMCSFRLTRNMTRASLMRNPICGAGGE